jgi:mRNA interferase MazF
MGARVTWPLSRGQVVLADLGLPEPKRFVVVSNNRRNRHLPQVLAARLTTTPKPAIPSIVALTTGDGMTGSVVCDDIVEIYADEVRRVVGALTPTTMARVNEGLAAALDLPRG